MEALFPIAGSTVSVRISPVSSHLLLTSIDTSISKDHTVVSHCVPLSMLVSSQYGYLCPVFPPLYSLCHLLLPVIPPQAITTRQGIVVK